MRANHSDKLSEKFDRKEIDFVSDTYLMNPD